MRNPWFIGAVVVGLAAIVVATVVYRVRGTDVSSAPTASEWADSVCTDLATWKSSITSLATTSGGTLTASSLKEKVQSAKTATDTLVSDLRDLDAPDLQAGDQLKQELDASASELQTSFQSLEDAAQAASQATTPAEFIQGLTKLAPAFQKLLDQISATVDQLRSSNAAGSAKAELQQAFDSSTACQNLRSGAG